jgi:hypothetical protein
MVRLKFYLDIRFKFYKIFFKHSSTWDDVSFSYIYLIHSGSIILSTLLDPSLQACTLSIFIYISY